MKTLGSIAGFVFLLGGCAGRIPEPKAPTMVRSFGGTLVPGYYVSPIAYEHYIRGQLMANEGRSEKAIEELRQALALDGASPYLRTRVAEELFGLGRLAEAREEVEAALHLDPEFAEAHLCQARLRERLGDQAGAVSALERAIAIERGNEEAYVELARLYRERGDRPHEEATWNELCRRVPSSAVGHEALGRAAIRRGDFTLAIAELRRALEKDDGLVDAREELATAYQATGQLDHAIATLVDAYDRVGDLRLVERLIRLELVAGRRDAARARLERLEEEKGDEERRLFIGWRWLELGDAVRAEETARAILAAPHEGAAAQYLLGEALAARGSLDEALLQLAAIPSGAHEFVAAKVLSGRLLSSRGRYGEAIDLMGHALTLAGEHGEGRDNLEGALAEMHVRAGRRDRAVSLLEAAVTRRPDSEVLALALGAAYQRDGQTKRAMAVGRAVLKRDPDSVRALNFLGYTLLRDGQRLDEARRLLERALRLEPLSELVADNLGWLYSRIGRLDDAERLLLQAERLSPARPEISQHLGELYVQKHERQHAADAFQRALRHASDESERHQLEEELFLLETGKLADGSTR